MVVLSVGFIVTVLASIMNNMPTILIAALAIGAAGATGVTHEAMIYAYVIGADPGPKIHAHWEPSHFALVACAEPQRHSH